MNDLYQWAARHNISPAAIADLIGMLRIGVTSDAGGAPDEAPPMSAPDEASVQNRVRLEAGRRGWLLFRNNVGAGKLENGSFVRWGLANDSEALNRKVKSADLIGVRPILIGPEHVGQTIGQFVSVECKRADWQYRGTDREVAQVKWATTVQAAGGYAVFSTGGL